MNNFRKILTEHGAGERTALSIQQRLAECARSKHWAIGALTLLLVAWAGLRMPIAGAAEYPTKLIRLIVPFTPGGPADILGRVLGQGLAERLGQQVLIDNRSGAGGTVAAGIAARAAPDGYTLFQCNIASNAIAASLYAKLPYEPLRDFAPITRIGTTTSALIVHPAMPVSSVAEFIAHAKANPGKVSYGSSGAGSSPHLAMELFKTMTGIDIVHIAYKGAAPALADLIGGQVAIGISNIPALLSPVQTGRARALAVTSAQRVSQLPSVPTMSESGLPGYEVTSWYGVCAPAGTPAPVLDKLHSGLRGYASSRTSAFSTLMSNTARIVVVT